MSDVSVRERLKIAVPLVGPEPSRFLPLSEILISRRWFTATRFLLLLVLLDLLPEFVEFLQRLGSRFNIPTDPPNRWVRFPERRERCGDQTT